MLRRGDPGDQEREWFGREVRAGVICAVVAVPIGWAMTQLPTLWAPFRSLFVAQWVAWWTLVMLGLGIGVTIASVRIERRGLRPRGVYVPLLVAWGCVAVVLGINLLDYAGVIRVQR